jgi:hypothetical protein
MRARVTRCSLGAVSAALKTLKSLPGYMTTRHKSPLLPQYEAGVAPVLQPRCVLITGSFAGRPASAAARADAHSVDTGRLEGMLDARMAGVFASLFGFHRSFTRP